ncbi:hypothetical protein SAMN05720606_105230 [Paenibacillus polysaccharolyticus]|uniref:Uncharacterized protein n=1 Tax=Paenibacillus polysaccharolyticus TaxID=582692 RepID=A0A1G5GE32_9BACL|nr:hypothetical protein SAMN05720606_105230 [Paenibacillus polysaccharolyticus]
MTSYLLNDSFTQKRRGQKKLEKRSARLYHRILSEDKENQKNLGITAIESCSVIEVPV